MATALITGSSRGIGAAIALRLAQDGFNIALNDLNESMFENNEIIEQIKETGVECEYFCADVSNYNQCEEMVNAVKERFGGLDVLVNNAGITKDGLMARMSEEQYDICCGTLRQSGTDKLFSFKSRYNRHDKNNRKRAWSKRNQRKCCSSGIY